MSIISRKTNHQQGMTTIGVILVLVVIAFFATIVIKLSPVYIEHYKVDSVLNTLKGEPMLMNATDASIRSGLAKRFDVNDVEHVSADDVVIDRTKGKVSSLSVDYEVRVPLIGNVDAVAKFSEEVKVTN